MTSEEDGTRRLADAELLTRCATIARVIVSHDKDFLIVAERRQRDGLSFAGVIYSPMRSTTIGQMVTGLELIATVLEPDEAANRFYLPLR